MTLLHYIVDVAENEKPSLLDFTDQLSNVKQVSRLNFDSLKAELLVWDKQLKELNTHLEQRPDDLPESMKGYNCSLFSHWITNVVFKKKIL